MVADFNTSPNGNGSHLLLRSCSRNSFANPTNIHLFCLVGRMGLKLFAWMMDGEIDLSLLGLL